MEPELAQEIVEEVYRLRGLLADRCKTMPDESLTFLRDFMYRINTQDNRCTATPIYYTIHEREEQPTDEDYADRSFWVDADGDKVATTITELYEYLRKRIINDFDDDATADCPDRKDALRLLDKQHEWELSEYAKEVFDIRLVFVKDVDKYTGVFLTEQACEVHIKANSYHYDKPRSYVHHAWRNPELERLLEILGELTGQPYVKH